MTSACPASLILCTVSGAESICCTSSSACTRFLFDGSTCVALPIVPNISDFTADAARLDAESVLASSPTANSVSPTADSFPLAPNSVFTAPSFALSSSPPTVIIETFFTTLPPPQSTATRTRRTTTLTPVTTRTTSTAPRTFTTSSDPPATPPPLDDGGGVETRTVLVATLGAGLFVLLAAVAGMWWFFRRRGRGSAVEPVRRVLPSAGREEGGKVGRSGARASTVGEAAPVLPRFEFSGSGGLGMMEGLGAEEIGRAI